MKIERLYKFFAKWTLIHRRKLDNEIYGLLSAYLTEEIIAGQTQRRTELNQMQKRIEENGKFINFLKKIK